MEMRNLQKLIEDKKVELNKIFYYFTWDGH